ncbi:NADP-dependent oxidoreductase [Antribacter gilvus]|uniref:NADP-dependent oxidoreductase n=1 Tax=Antribacter gilvus TaxID=2304675 RepID=UPI000F7B1BBB|nr:NADP-dependent oxidoreductase [Antribacter gilvus]
MRAIVIEQFGGPEVLHVGEVPDPEPGPGQVLVRVEAAGVNPFDGKVRSGSMEQFFRTPLPKVLGLDVAGTVVAAGDGADVGRGTRVVGTTGAGYAELAVLNLWTELPGGLDAVRAAALPSVGEAARRGLRILGVQPGETLLVHGASGAVGGIAVQLAVAAGVTVVGTASAWHLDRVEKYGATAVEYGEGLVDRVRALAPQGVDAVLDAAGRGVLPDSIALRGGTERILTLADGAAYGLGVEFSQQADPSAEALADLVGLVARGAVTVPVTRVLSFEEAPEAHALVDSGRAGGKVVLVP